MKRALLSVPALLLLPALVAAQTPATSPQDIAKAKLAAKAGRATRILGEAVALDNGPVTPATPATRASRATPATPNPDGGPATPATPAVPASPSHRPAHAGQGGQGRSNNPRRP
jgi:hypothetical protein